MKKLIYGLFVVLFLCWSQPAKALTWCDIIYGYEYCQQTGQDPTPTPITTPEPSAIPTQEPTPEPTSQPTVEPTPQPTSTPDPYLCSIFGDAFCSDPSIHTWESNQGNQLYISCSGKPGSWNEPPLELQPGQEYVVSGDNAGPLSGDLDFTWLYTFDTYLYVYNESPTDSITLRTTTILSPGNNVDICGFTIDSCGWPFGQTNDYNIPPGGMMIPFHRSDTFDVDTFAFGGVVVEVVDTTGKGLSLRCDGVTWLTHEQGAYR